MMTDDRASVEGERELLPCPMCATGFVDYTNYGRGVHAVACAGCGTQTRFYHRKKDARSAWNARTPEPSARVATVSKIETVTGSFYQEPGEPFWRIEIDGYCADFDYEKAAENLAAAINRLVAPPPPSAPALAEREACAAIADEYGQRRIVLQHPGLLAARRIAAAIRARTISEEG